MATNFKHPGSIEEALARIRSRYNTGLGGVVTSEPYYPSPKPETAEDPGLLGKVLSGAGSALGAAKTYGVDLPVNYFSTKPLRQRAEKFWETGEEQYRPVPAEELAKDAYVGRPEAGEPEVVQHAKGAARGAVGRYIGVTTDPVNIALMAGGGLVARAGGALAAKAMHMGFSAMMAKATYDAADSAYTEYRKEGWTPAVSEKATEAAIDAGLTVAPLLGMRKPKTAPDPGTALARRGPVYEGEVVDYRVPDIAWMPRPGLPPAGESGASTPGAPPPGPGPRRPPPSPGAPGAPTGPTRSSILGAIRQVDAQIREVTEALSRRPGEGGGPATFTPESKAQLEARRAELIETRQSLEKMYHEAPQDIGTDIPPAPAPAPPPPAPSSAVAPAPSKTAYEKPTVSQMSKSAVNSAIAGIDAKIAEANALNLHNEVAELTKLRQALSEAYSVKNQPPSQERHPWQEPGVQSQLELVGLQQSLKLQADEARAAGDGARAAELDAVASSIESQITQPGGVKGPKAPVPESPTDALGAPVPPGQPPAGPTSDVQVGGPQEPVTGPEGPLSPTEAATAGAQTATAESVKAAGEVGENLFPGTQPTGDAGPLANVVGGTPAPGAATRLRRPQFVEEAAGVQAPPDTAALGYPPGVRAGGVAPVAAAPAAPPQPTELGPGIPDTGVLTDEEAAALVAAASAPEEGYYADPPPSIVMMDDETRAAYLEAVDGIIAEDPGIDSPEKLTLAAEESGLPMDDEEAAWHLARNGRGEPAAAPPAAENWRDIPAESDLTDEQATELAAFLADIKPNEQGNSLSVILGNRGQVTGIGEVTPEGEVVNLSGPRGGSWGEFVDSERLQMGFERKEPAPVPDVLAPPVPDVLAPPAPEGRVVESPEKDVLGWTQYEEHSGFKPGQTVAFGKRKKTGTIRRIYEVPPTKTKPGGVRAELFVDEKSKEFPRGYTTSRPLTELTPSIPTDLTPALVEINEGFQGLEGLPSGLKQTPGGYIGTVQKTLESIAREMESPRGPSEFHVWHLEDVTEGIPGAAEWIEKLKAVHPNLAKPPAKTDNEFPAAVRWMQITEWLSGTSSEGRKFLTRLRTYHKKALAETRYVRKGGEYHGLPVTEPEHRQAVEAFFRQLDKAKERLPQVPEVLARVDEYKEMLKAAGWPVQRREYAEPVVQGRDFDEWLLEEHGIGPNAAGFDARDGGKGEMISPDERWELYDQFLDLADAESEVAEGLRPPEEDPRASEIMGQLVGIVQGKIEARPGETDALLRELEPLIGPDALNNLEEELRRIAMEEGEEGPADVLAEAPLPVRGDVSKDPAGGWRVRTYDREGNVVTEETGLRTKKQAKQFLGALQPELKRNRTQVHAVTLEPWEKKLVEFDPDSDPENIPGPVGPMELEVQIQMAYDGGKAGSALKALRRAKQIGGVDIHPNWIKHFPFIEGLETTGKATPWRPGEIPRTLGPYLSMAQQKALEDQARQPPDPELVAAMEEGLRDYAESLGLEVLEEDATAPEAPPAAEEVTTDELPALADMLKAEGFLDEIPNPTTEDVLDALKAHGIAATYPDAEIVENILKGVPDVLAQEDAPVGGKPAEAPPEPLPEALPETGEEAGVGGETQVVSGELEGAVVDSPGAGDVEGTGIQPSGGASQPDGVPAGSQPALAPAPEGTSHGDIPPGVPNTPATTPKPELPDYAPKGSADPFFENRTWSQKVTDNVAAIRLLKELEANERVPTPEEQETLAKFVGWGGMPRLFDPYARGAESTEKIDTNVIDSARAEIQEMMTEAEFSAGQMSTPNAHYTGVNVVRAMWDVLEALGVSPGQRILEPSMGTGNFFAMAPDGLRKTGVELDSLTGRIAKKLHPNATVIMSGLEEADLPDNFYDVVVGNPPFGKIKVFDPSYKSDKVVTEAIHNYMLIKGLDKLRPGGVLMYVTSRYTMDAKDPAIRERVAERAKLLGAVRLPNTTFQKNANTSVITDVLLFQKYRPGEAKEVQPDWLKTEKNPHDEWRPGYGGGGTVDTEGRDVWRNAVWETKRGRVLGTEGLGRGMYGAGEYMVTGDPPTRQQLADAFRNMLPEGKPLADLTQEERFARLERKPFDPEQMKGVKPGNFVIDEDGKIWQALTGELEEWEPPESANPGLKDTPRAKKMAEAKLAKLKEKIKDYLPLRDATKTLLAGQVDPTVSDAEFKKLQAAAEKEYDAFVKKHGPLHARPNPSQLAEDPDFPNVLALEKDFAPEQKVGKKVVQKAQATKADIFTKRLIPRREKVTTADSPAAAYAVALSESGRLDFDRMAELTGQSKEALQADLEGEGIIYHDPQKGAFEPADQYLSGNVRKKLKAAEAAAAEDSRYKGNVEALQQVVPREKLPEQINAALGSPWISGTYVEQFIAHLAGLDPNHYMVERLKAHYIESIATWRITHLKTVLGENTTGGVATWGTDYYTAAAAIEDILNLRDPQIWSQDEDGNRYLDIEKTENAKEIKLKIEQEWRDWLWSDEKRATDLTKIFNENFYGTVPRRFDGKHLTFPGMNRAGLRNNDLDQHQKDGVWQMLQSPNTLIALPVGAGKTFTAIAAAMEARRMGIAQKPLFAVPASVLPQWIRAFKQLYPHANVLAVDPQDMTAKSRGRVMSRIATGDWDSIVVTHEGLEKLPLARATVERMIGEELKILDRAFLDILRDKSLQFTEAMDAEIQDYIELTIAYQKKLFDFKRDRRYRKNKKAKFIPYTTPKGESTMVDLKTYTKVAKPRTPTFNDQNTKEALKGMEKQQARLVKELAKAKLNLKTRILKFLDPSRKDKGISFDELGIDWIVVDESHKYKRLYFTTKMQRLSGLSTDSSNRSYDLYMKGRLVQERNNGGGLHFLTGTPLTNTIAEMYNLMRYLAPDFLRENGLEHFDAWAKVYATTKTGIEVDPTGSRMRTQKRFNKFVNLGSLLRAFRDFTLYRTPDELGIPRPQLAKNADGARKAQVVIVPKSKQLEDYVKFLVKRAERLRNNKDIDPTDDNPLLITMDGMKAALDMRLVDPNAPDSPQSKLNQSIGKIFEIWKATKEGRKTQMVFLDLGTPSADAKATMAVYERDANGARKSKKDVPKLNLYADIKKKLVAKGVPAEEIEFIHDWSVDKGGLKAEERMAELFHRMNTGQTRILLSSSGKGGVGVNVQQKLIALHHLDVPYTPDWIEQRNGRIQRQGNENPEVQIYEWVAKGTFDIYKWQLVGQKSEFINSALSGSLEADEVEDLSFVGLSAEEVIALGSDNPLIRERMVRQKELERIERLFHAFAESKAKLAQQIGRAEHTVDLARKAVAHLQRISGARTEEFVYKDLEGKAHTGKRADVAAAMLKTVQGQFKLLMEGQDATIGSIRGIPVHITKYGNSFSTQAGFVKNGGGRVEVSATNPEPDAKELDSWIASIESQLGKTMLETKLRQAADTLKTYEAQLAKIREKTEEKFPHSERELELRRELQDIENQLGLGKDDAGTSRLGDEDFDGPGATDGGEGGAPPPPKGPRTGGDFEDPPDDPRFEGQGGGNEAPQGRPDQGAQPGDPGWEGRVRGARERTRRRGKGGTANMGVDPQAFWDGVILGVELMRKGFQTFGRWVAGLVAQLGGNPGENILRRIWRAAKEWFAPRPAGADPRIRGAAETAQGFEGRRRPTGEPTPRPTSKETRRAAEEAARDDYEAPRSRGKGKPPDFDINLEWIRDEGGIRELEARIVEQLKRVMTDARSYRSWAEARRKAVLAGLTERDFNRILREKGAVTDWEIEAGRMLREAAARDMQAKLSRWKELDARAKEATGDTRQTLIEEALEAKRDYISSVGKFAGIAADTVRAGSEAGRALAMHRKFAEGLTPEERFIKRLLRGLPTPDDALVAELAKALASGDQAAIMAASRKILNPGALPMVVEFFINSVLSGPATLAANVLGNFTHEAVVRTPERGLAAQLEERGFRQWIERLLTGEATPQERVSGEAWEATKAQWKLKFGFIEGLKAMAHATLSEGVDFQGAKGEYHMPAIPGLAGKVVRTPGRWMEALDVGAKAAAASAERAAGVFRAAVLEGRRKGWNEAQVRERMEKLDSELRRYEEIEALREVNPRALKQSDYNYLAKHARGDVGKIYKAKKHAALESTFRDEVMQLTKYLQLARTQYPWLAFAVPFIKTPERILVQGFRRTPIGLAKTIANIRSGKLKGGEASDRLAQGIIGTVVSAGLYMLAKDGIITGGGPADPRERSIKMKTGWKPYAVNIGGTHISLQRIEPIATQLGLAADLAEALDEKTAGDVWDKLHYSVINNVANKTYLQGIVSTAEAFGDPKRYGAQLQKRLIGAMVPNLLASAARAIDPTVRQTDDISSTLLARVPWLSRTLPAKVTGTGESIDRGEDPLSRFASPFRYAKEAGPERNLERLFIETGYIPSAPPRHMTLPGTRGKKIMLTPEERQVYAGYAQRATAFARNLAANADWSGLDIFAKEELIKRIYRFAHDAARRDLYGRLYRRIQQGDYEMKD